MMNRVSTIATLAQHWVFSNERIFHYIWFGCWFRGPEETHRRCARITLSMPLPLGIILFNEFLTYQSTKSNIKYWAIIFNYGLSCMRWFHDSWISNWSHKWINVCMCLCVCVFHMIQELHDCWKFSSDYRIRYEWRILWFNCDRPFGHVNLASFDLLFAIDFQS